MKGFTDSDGHTALAWPSSKPLDKLREGHLVFATNCAIGGSLPVDGNHTVLVTEAEPVVPLLRRRVVTRVGPLHVLLFRPPLAKLKHRLTDAQVVDLTQAGGLDLSKEPRKVLLGDLPYPRADFQLHGIRVRGKATLVIRLQDHEHIEELGISRHPAKVPGPG